MNLLVTFSVNFPQQEECPSSRGHGAHTLSRHGNGLEMLPFRLVSFIKIGGCQAGALAQEREVVAVYLKKIIAYGWVFWQGKKKNL